MYCGVFRRFSDVLDVLGVFIGVSLGFSVVCGLLVL